MVADLQHVSDRVETADLGTAHLRLDGNAHKPMRSIRWGRAARHPALEGHEPHLRSHLALLAHRHDFAWQIAGEPRVVIDAAEQQAMTHAKLLGEAIDAIWRAPMIEPKDAAVALGAKASNREKVRVHRERSWLLGLPRDRRCLYPAFQFDPLRLSVFPEVQT